MHGSKQGQLIETVMQWIINLLSSYDVRLIIAGILVAVAALLFRRALTPPPAVETPQPLPYEQWLSVGSIAVAKAFEDYATFRAELTDIPNEFWTTVQDTEFPSLAAIAPMKSDRIQNFGLQCVVDAFVLDQYVDTPTVMLRFYGNKNAKDDLKRFVERIKGFKVGKQQ